MLRPQPIKFRSRISGLKLKNAKKCQFYNKCPLDLCDAFPDLCLWKFREIHRTSLHMFLSAREISRMKTSKGHSKPSQFPHEYQTISSIFSLDEYMFSPVFVYAILQKFNNLGNLKDGDRVSKKFKVSQIAARKIKIPEVLLPYFYAIVGISMGVTVVNVVRTVVTEKATVKVSH